MTRSSVLYRIARARRHCGHRDRSPAGHLRGAGTRGGRAEKVFRLLKPIKERRRPARPRRLCNLCSPLSPVSPRVRACVQVSAACERRRGRVAGPRRVPGAVGGKGTCARVATCVCCARSARGARGAPVSTFQGSAGGGGPGARELLAPCASAWRGLGAGKQSLTQVHPVS